MYGSLFREWKVAAMFVGGIAFVVVMVFSEKGGDNPLLPQRKAAETAVITPPKPKSAVRPRPPADGGFTSDAELEAAFAVPSTSASAATKAETAAAKPSDETGAKPSTIAVELDPASEPLH